MHNISVPQTAKGPRLRVGIVGPGRTASFQIAAIRALGHEVTGVVGRNPKRTQLAARLLGVPAVDSLDQLLAGIDVLHDTTPNSRHYENVLKAADARVAVICDKPLGLSPQQTQAMLDAAQRAGIVHATHLQRRYWPQVREMRRRLTEGELGAPRLLLANFLQDWLVLPADDDWRLEPEEGGEVRAVLDLMPHIADLLSYTTSREVEQVQARLTEFVPRQHARVIANDAGIISLSMAGGAIAQVVISQASHGHNELNLQIDCDHASLEWHEGDPTLWVLRRGQPRRGTHVGDEDPRVSFYHDVYRAVSNGEPPQNPTYPTFEAGHRQALIIDAIATSARDGGTPVAVQR